MTAGLDWHSECLAYLGERTGTYEHRTLRYAAVADKLEAMGLADGDLVVDLGAGMCEFARYLYTTRGWSGRYLPVDGSIDGTDLEVWSPPVRADFFVAIELIEHLRRPDRLLLLMRHAARKGVVVTTPNPEVVDVLAIDRTHLSPIQPWRLGANGLYSERRSFFGKANDSLIGWWER